MPILAAEPMLYPADLFELAGAEASAGRVWRVAHTRPRQEKALARHLLTAGVSYFLPQHQQRARRQGRSQRSWQPVFPGYLFFLGDESARMDALQSNRIASLLSVSNQDEFLDDLRRVHVLVDSQLPLYEEERLRPGMAVRITGGPLMGLTGTIEQHKTAYRFVVAVTFIGRGISAEVEACDIEPIAEEQPVLVGAPAGIQ